MRLFFPLAAVAIAVACSDSSDWTLGPEATARATRTERNNEWLPFSVTDVDNPCTAAVEQIDLQGKIHGQGSLWDSGHFKSHYNVTLSGADADGVRYQGTSTGNGSGKSLGSQNTDMVISTVINSLGSFPNFTTKIVLHFAKDGALNVEKLREECRG